MKSSLPEEDEWKKGIWITFLHSNGLLLQLLLINSVHLIRLLFIEAPNRRPSAESHVSTRRRASVDTRAGRLISLVARGDLCANSKRPKGGEIRGFFPYGTHFFLLV